MKYLPGGPLVRKSLEIIRCSQCHYLSWTGSHVGERDSEGVWFGEGVCLKMDDDPRPSRIYRPGEIPHWCPLEDWPEE